MRSYCKSTKRHWLAEITFEICVKGGQIYKLYVRPHLDYGDIIYLKYDPDKQLNFTEQLEQAQYKAAPAFSGAWKGTNRLRLLEELGWETLYD